MIVGDTHGNITWLRRYIFPVAVMVEADTIIVVGDFGAWEHTHAGVTFMNEVDDLTRVTETPLYWLHGNHDKYSHTLAAYGDNLDDAGFVICRPQLLYIPQGHCWTWAGKAFRSFGGAYSVDKEWRIEQEQHREQVYQRQARYKVGQGDLFSAETVASQAGTLWFPEEEMTDDDMIQLLAADSSTKNIVLSHDKPYSARPDWNRKDITECLPNQLRLEHALRAHRPQLWIHGHLHYFYTDDIYGGSWGTKVVGLEPDNDAAQHSDWRRDQTWVLLDLAGPEATLTVGRDITLDLGELGEVRDRIAAQLAL